MCQYCRAVNRPHSIITDIETGFKAEACNECINLALEDCSNYRAYKLGTITKLDDRELVSLLKSMKYIENIKARVNS